ncbi:hypothetical protein BCR43DRAFT_52167 [Syncephalastrum racemosum]|uniref:Uncharacterized protein n=1 Tax=Syncephalastrum racemosum TaxID=13706 RepID=A0A1X2HV50_SYNRA|nr:hypothetical protein BCR43DRAFT_52167 [Syncephalastrum racemosum]
MQCFELSSYLAVNVENTSWKCPHCHGYTPPHQLARDFFFERLIQEAGKQAVEIEFRGDCDQWRVTRSETPDDGDDFDEDDEPDKKRLPASTEEPANVISLISDDEDDEPPQLPSGPSTTTTNMTTSHTATTTTTTTITTMPSAGQRRDGRSLSADLSPGTPADNSTSHSNKRSRLNFEFGDLNLEPDADFHRVLMGIDSNSH